MKARLPYLAIVLLMLPFLASFLGCLHPLGDSLAVFRLWLAVPAVVAAVAMVVAGYRRTGLVAIIAIVALVLPILFDHLPVAAVPADYALYQKNLFFRSDNQAGLITDIAGTKPDFITFQEVSPGNIQVLDNLSHDYPSQLFCPFAAVGGTAVLSRWPLLNGQIRCGDGFAAMAVKTPAGAVWLVSLHLHWPFPKGQKQQLDRIVPELSALNGPVILGGDFNMVPWSHTFRRIANATGTTQALPVHYTLRLVRRKLALLPLDHVLVPTTATAISVIRRPTFRSDHHGILARFSLQPTPISAGSNG
ncbi:MAG: endonuclease/exonuclease/phosphatase family protein [Rhodobacteraceae bacterium]|nr:endonuclease/exonuclease/phosphatase family protein [Paracoccaceae bacterium]